MTPKIHLKVKVVDHVVMLEVEAGENSGRISGTYDDSTPTTVAYELNEPDYNMNLDLGALSTHVPFEEIGVQVHADLDDLNALVFSIRVEVDGEEFEAGIENIKDVATVHVEIPEKYVDSDEIQSRHEMVVNYQDLKSPTLRYRGHHNYDQFFASYLYELDENDSLARLEMTVEGYQMTYAHTNENHVVNLHIPKTGQFYIELTPYVFTFQMASSEYTYGLEVDWSGENVNVELEKDGETVNFETSNFKQFLAKLNHEIQFTHGTFSNDNTCRIFFGVTVDGVKKMLIWELSFTENGVKADVIIKNDKELSNLFVFEVSLSEQYDIEAYFEYHKTIYELLEMRPDGVKDDIMTYLESWMTSDQEVKFFKFIADVVAELVIENNEVADFDRDLWISQLENILQGIVDEIKKLNPEAATEKGNDFTFGDITARGFQIVQEMVESKLENLGDDLKESMKNKAENALDELDHLKATKMGRDLHDALTKITHILVEEVGEYLMKILNLAENPQNSLVQINQNQIYFRLPTPQLSILQILDQFFLNLDSTEFEKWSKPSHWSDLYYTMVAAFGKQFGQHKMIREGEFFAELVDFKYVRQWDGQWLQIDAECPIVLAKRVADKDWQYNVNPREREVTFIDEATGYKEVETSEPIFVVISGTQNRNKITGAFGIPDSEVYTDDLSNPVFESIFGDCVPQVDDLPDPSEATEDFKAFFEDSNSTARSCFPIVSPAPYMSMYDSDLCIIANAYRLQCEVEGAKIELPENCSRLHSYNVNFYPR